MNRITINHIGYILGFFLVSPFLYLPLGVTNARIDDLMIVVIAMFTLASGTLGLNKKVVSLVMLFFVFIVWGVLVRSNNNLEYTNYPAVRIFGISLYFLVISAYVKNQSGIYHVAKGVVSGTKLFLAAAGFALVYHLYSIGFNVTNLYSMKDSLYILGPHNPNTYGALTVFGSFSAFVLYRYSNEKQYKYFAIIFLFFPFLFLIKRDVLGVLVALVYLYVAYQKPPIKVFFYLLLLCLAACSMVFVYGLWNDPEFIRLMANRVNLYTGAFNAIVNNPLGHGIGTEISVLEPLTGRANVSHNSFLSMAIELGPIFALLFLGILTRIFFSLKFIWLRFYFIVFFVQSLFGNGFYFYKYHFMFILLSLLIVTLERQKTRYEYNYLLNK